MKTKKFFLAILLSFVFTISIAGCFGGVQTDSSTPSESEQISSSKQEEVSSESKESSTIIYNSSESTSSSENSSSSESSSDSSVVETPKLDKMEIHFPVFANKVSGDCTLIKVGDTELLIDAGSTRGAAKTIVPYIEQYCTDGVLEYVVATHAHEDHIAAFVGETSIKTDGVFDAFACGTIIDFVKTKSTSQIYKDYVSLRNAEVSAGATHYTALECYKQTGGAKRSYELGEGISFQILYQKYYEESTSNENNNSVCLLVTEGENNYLFTGDLESGGEKSLVEKNTLPKCKLYKSGHHGSNTSSCSELMSKIQPEIVVITCCCGDKHGFPHQETINTIAKYTSLVYVPVMATSNGYELLNGNVVVTADNGKVTVKGSKNNTLFKDTAWFKNNRTMPNEWKIAG